MKQTKIVSMIGALVLMISAAAFITGCKQPNSDNAGAVGVQLPDDLQNTTWNHNSESASIKNNITLEFGTNSLKSTSNGVVVNYTIDSAAKGGKIEVTNGTGSGANAVLCESYSISGSTLTLKGGMHGTGLSYTKK